MFAGSALLPGLQLLLVLAAANVAPLAARHWLKQRWDAPIDAGLRFVDGRPLLGPSKTWRGVGAAVAAAAAAAWVLGIPAGIGALLGAGAMAGDALASFTKRRLGLASSSRAPGLDQVPEALLPLLLLHAVAPLPWALVAGVTAAFALLEAPFARLWHALGWREQPY